MAHFLLLSVICTTIGFFTAILPGTQARAQAQIVEGEQIPTPETSVIS